MSKGRILFIDDDNFLRKVYQAELTEKGFEVFLAVDGIDGLKKMAELMPDLIILDLIMPRKDGFEVLADMQRYIETADIPVIVLSNLAQSDDQKRALDLGAVDYLVKDNTTLDIIANKIVQHINSKPKNTATPTEHFPLGKKRSGEGKPVGGDISVKKTTQKEGENSKQPIANKPPSRGHNFCSECGFKLGRSVHFCPDCGAQQDITK